MTAHARRLPWIVTIAALSLAGYAGLFGEPPAPPNPKPAEKPDADRVARGTTTFQVYCASCHGRSGEGNGPMKEVLRVQPADLTVLARENGGTFPEDEVYATIDGRHAVRGHGSREMPVWGLGFQDPGRDSNQEEEVHQRLLDLLAFLRSIQK